MTEQFARSGERYISWLQNEALPFWAEQAADPRGGFVEALSHRGEPTREMAKSLRGQARLAFSFARAEAIGLIANGREASDQAFSYMLDQAALHDDAWVGGFAHVLTPEGKQKDLSLDTCDQACVLLAASERAKVYRDDASAVVARGILDVLERLRAPAGGFLEGNPSKQPRRQNTHMHILEACLNLRDVKGFDPITADIEAMVALFTDHFLDPAHMILREAFTDDWGIDPDDGGIIVPGHMAEWAWLLMTEGSLTGAEFMAQTLLDEAIKRGADGDNPLLCNSVDLASGAQSNGCRLWPQAQLARAHLLFTEADPSRFDRSAAVIDRMFDHFLGAPPKAPGGWFDEIDRTGKAISTVIASSTLYHLVVLADDVTQVLGEL
ncbi:MAG: AGE family epimerase/isomerase [Pseudomonadota bacterium]